jgi:HPt (histidine-containing phosphotransfer) domain-containing protein
MELDRMYLLTCADGDAALANALLCEFVSHLGAYVAELDEAASPAQWRDGAHRIKGAAQGIGALRLAQTTAAIEEAPPLEPAQALAAQALLEAHLHALRELARQA